MTYTLRLLTEESRDLVVEALRTEAAKRTRVAQGAALALADDRAARKDVRAASVRVTDLLAEAGRLDQLATELAATDDVPLIAPGEQITIAVVPPGTLTDFEEHVIEATADGDLDGIDRQLAEELGDDGLSDAAHAAMAQADKFADTYLADPDGADVDTHAIGEDDPADDDVEDVLK